MDEIAPNTFRSYHAQDRGQLTLAFTLTPDFASVTERRVGYTQEARLLTQLLLGHLPEGLIDALYAQLTLHHVAVVTRLQEDTPC